MPRRLFLLAGLHKTATTSVQRTCMANLDLIHGAGFSYVVMNDDASGNHTALLNILFKQDLRRYGPLKQRRWEHAEAFEEARRRNLERMAAVLKEGSCDFLMAAEGVSIYAIEDLQVLRDWFAGQGWHVQVFCHVRQPSAWVHSMVAQRVTGGLRMTIAAAIEEFLAAGSLVRRRIENLQAVFPDAGFYRHEDAVRHPQGPPGFFLEKLGVDVERLKPVRANERASDAAVRAISTINEKSPEHPVDDLRQLPGSRFLLSAQELRPLLPLIAAETEWLAGQRFS